MQREWWRAPVALVLLGVLLSALHGLGDGPLEAPPPVPAGWPAWFTGREAALVVAVALRLLGLGLGWYLFAVVGLAWLGRVIGSRSLLALARRLTLPAWRPFLHRAVGFAVAVSVVTAGLPVGGPGTGGPAFADQVALHQSLPVAHPLGQAAAGLAPTDRPVRAEAPALADLVPLAWHARASDGTDGPGPANHVVSRGQSFWSIAHDRLQQAGVVADEVAVRGYWLELIAWNRHRLVDRDDPDLILPGQVFLLPPVAPHQE